MKYTNTKEDQARLENTAAVNLLIHFIELKEEKKESIRGIDSRNTLDDYQVIKTQLQFEVEFLSQNIDALRKQIEEQKFNY